ncbi:hypothetical protein SAMN05216351_12313 [Pseudobutyrivibrio sp. JW11]|uniref:hypothetical protein n=1 Tax=Pseudobutyrivibrio sp. JW11 TaxID=1855302 RepID=UPI0008F3B3AC|nr:hypothetical protein [Pseudobutyrivibrio sp. JW11]SFO64951.1 hypothetical protein SAMN05216351_12313 [Pseudobutyrivibrio sp. JW11]
METKEWIQVVVEIIGNGVALAIFGKWLDIKFKSAERKDELHSSTVKNFFEELVKLNKAMIQVNATIQINKINDSSKIIQLLKDNVMAKWVEIINIYDTYEYDLKKFEKEYKELDEAWKDFVSQTDPIELDKKLDIFKQKNKALINSVRKKY